jgi:predicted HTH transcriptional regulator
MAVVAAKVKKTVRKKRTTKPAPMTRAEMVQKMFADQQIIREAIQNGITFKELREKYGYKFATV